ncbi:MAG: crossover junction endodeoxyribonuclease RuvC [Verrucomicrobia bacterium]|nr:crossover junction endodeoxyribonuclease RuvC [Verrucomicrobiota bacterium]
MGITPAQFQQLQQRTAASGRRLAAPVDPGAPAGAARRHSLVLGIDPSLRGTGYGIIRLLKTGPTLVAAGTIKCPAAWRRSRCLVKIMQSLRDVVRSHSPEVCAIEGLFYAQNLQTAIIMGEARGAALAAIAESGLDIYEIATRKVKQAIVGYGAAQKLAVAKMVQRLLNLDEVPEPDAADALALALTHAREQGRYALKNAKPL